MSSPEQPREGERIAKLLARAGIASRREVERMIAEGRVKLNDEVITTPNTVLPNLKGVSVDGKPVKAAKIVGGSTITQQLAKNLFLSGQRSYLRKAQEMVITFMLEAVMDKRRIFEIYLNVVEWGNGVFGCEAASRKYYGVPAANLGPAEAAKLAVMLPNPRYFGRHLDSNYLARRTMLIQTRMNSADLP